MVSALPPFNEAKTDEFYYKFIYNKKWPIFWKYHYRGKPAGENFFSPEFKDLMQKLLAYNPDERPTIEEIRAHPWMQGTMPSFAEVFEDCNARQERNEETKAEERRQRRGGNYGEDRHRGIGD